MSSGNLLPCPRASGLLFRTVSAGLLSAYSENGMLVGDSRCSFRASAVVSSRLSRDSPWSCRTDDRGLEELASRIEAVVIRGGGRCSCSHAGLAERYLYRRYVPAWSNLKAVASCSYLALAHTARSYQSTEYSKLTPKVACNRVFCTQIRERATCLRHFGCVTTLNDCTKTAMNRNTSGYLLSGAFRTALGSADLQYHCGRGFL